MIKSYNQEHLIEDLQSGVRIYLFFENAGCGTCKLVKPDIEKVAKYVDDIFYFVDASEAENLQTRLNVEGYPTLSLIEGDQVICNALGHSRILDLVCERFLS